MNRIIDYILTKNAQRNIGLDFMRCFAILITVYGHAVLLVAPNYRSAHNALTSAFDGVSIFFVLSGYLIGGILVRELKKDHFSIGQFWTRRWMRTLPAYFFIFIVLSLFAIYHNTFQSSYWQYLYFSQNLFSPASFFFSESWSLAIEEWFYLLFPVIVLIFSWQSKNVKTALLYTIVLFFTVPILYTFYMYANGIGLEDWDANYRRIVSTRLNSIAFGILLVYIENYIPTIWQRLQKVGLKLTALAIVLSFVLPKLGLYTLAYNVFLRAHIECLIAFFALPYLTTIKQLPSPFLTKWIRLISIVSYSMYLLNLSVLLRNIFVPFQSSTWFLSMGSAGYFIVYVAFYALLMVLSILMYRFIELPFLSLRDYLTTGKSLKRHEVAS